MMGSYDLSDGGILIGLVGIAIGIYGLYQKHQMDKLDRLIAEKEAALNAPEQSTVTPH
jgi:hypothetical protein